MVAILLFSDRGNIGLPLYMHGWVRMGVAVPVGLGGALPVVSDVFKVDLASVKSSSLSSVCVFCTCESTTSCYVEGLCANTSPITAAITTSCCVEGLCANTSPIASK